MLELLKSEIEHEAIENMSRGVEAMKSPHADTGAPVNRRLSSVFDS